MRIPILLLENALNGIPVYATKGAAGCDLHAAITETIIIQPGKTCLIPTGISLEIPEGYEGQVRIRSGLALKNSVHVLNAPGTIDSDYRGEIGVILHNAGEHPFTVQRGDRIAQLVFAVVQQAEWDIVQNLTETGRDKGGFGSTGV